MAKKVNKNKQKLCFFGPFLAAKAAQLVEMYVR